MKHNHAYTHTQSSLQPSQREKKISDLLELFILWIRGDFWFCSIELHIFLKGVKKVKQEEEGCGAFSPCGLWSWLCAGTVASSGQLLSSGKALDVKQVSDWSLWLWLSWMKAFPRSILIFLFKSIWKTIIFPAFPPSVCNFQNACSAGLQTCRKFFL